MTGNCAASFSSRATGACGPSRISASHRSSSSASLARCSLRLAATALSASWYPAGSATAYSASTRSAWKGCWRPNCTPSRRDRRLRSSRALASGRYPISAAVLKMCSLVVALTPLAPRIAIETSATDTPARAATSARVGRFPPGTGIIGLPILERSSLELSSY